MRHDLERRLIDDLERLRQDVPFSVDVTARVMAEVRRLGPPPRPVIASRRVVVWSSAAAILLATGVALLALLGLPAWAETWDRPPRGRPGSGEASFASPRGCRARRRGPSPSVSTS